MSPLSLVAIYTSTSTHTHPHAYAQARKHRQTLCTKPEIFPPQVKPRLDRFKSANRPWLLAVGAGWWHVLKEAGSSGQYEPSKNGHKPGAHAFMFRYYANWSAYGLLQHIESSGFWILCLVRPQVQPSCRKSSTDPVPSPPHPLCRQRAGENRIRDTDEAPLSCSRPRWREAGVAKAHRRVTIIIHREKNTRISPNSPPNALYIGDLKGQIRWFLTLSARSLPVFTEPNASPSVTSVCPLLYTPSLPFLPLSFSLPPSDPVTAPLTQGLPNKHFQTSTRTDRPDSSSKQEEFEYIIQLCSIKERITLCHLFCWGIVPFLERHL